MMLSLFLAKVIGLVLMLVAAALFFNKKNVELLFKIYSHTEAVFITGIIEAFLGLALIINHNIWTWDFRGVITVIGWMLLLRGLGRTFFPKKVINWLQKFKKMKAVMTPLLLIVFLVGAYLAYMGFTR